MTDIKLSEADEAGVKAVAYALYSSHAPSYLEKARVAIRAYLASRTAAPQPEAGPSVEVEAFAALLSYAERQQCHHDDTYRGGIIWTICNGCGRKWADDEGGFQPYQEPAELARAREALARQLSAAQVPGWKEAAIAWEVCGSIHREYAKGKDPFFTTRQGDFVKHAETARRLAALPAQPQERGAPEVECPKCKGSGDKDYQAGSGPDAYTVTDSCDGCNGEGVVASAPAAGEKRLNTMSNARAPDNGEGLPPELANITLSREFIEMILRDFKASAAHAPVEDRIFFNSTGKLIADALSIAGRCNKGKGGLYRIAVMDRREECPDFERKRKAPAPTATPGEGE